MGPTAHASFAKISSKIFPENSLAAFDRAIQLGADGIEFDVQRTKDHKIVVIHSQELNQNVAGADRGAKNLGLVSDYNRESLAQFDIGNGHQIPTLDSTLDLVSDANSASKRRKHNNLTINIDLKDPNAVEQTCHIVSGYIEKGLIAQHDVIYNTYEHSTLRELREKAPSAQIVAGILTTDLFDEKNISTGYTVLPNSPYRSSGLQMLSNLHSDIGCHGFECSTECPSSNDLRHIGQI
ncbi:MAG: hypothetical protein KTR28_01590 [Micavibrio sp.]|nr:hypothetical protein [Micavibrio sp.]